MSDSEPPPPPPPPPPSREPAPDNSWIEFEHIRKSTDSKDMENRRR